MGIFRTWSATTQEPRPATYPTTTSRDETVTRYQHPDETQQRSKNIRTKRISSWSSWDPSRPQAIAECHDSTPKMIARAAEADLRKPRGGVARKSGCKGSRQREPGRCGVRCGRPQQRRHHSRSHEVPGAEGTQGLQQVHRQARSRFAAAPATMACPAPKPATTRASRRTRNEIWGTRRPNRACKASSRLRCANRPGVIETTLAQVEHWEDQQ